MKSKIASFFNALFINFREWSITSKIEKVILRMRPSEKIFFFLASSVFVISSIILLIRVHDSFLVEVPTFGGSFTEGLVGSPRFINPVLAISETDKDLSSLIYSGLLKVSPEKEGEFISDLAESYQIEEEGKVYHFFIKENAVFHDNKPVLAEDVLFTIEKILDPVIKSPRANNWQGVVVEKIGEREIKFTLSKPYAPFLYALTIGILPKHIWQEATSEEFPFSEFNINPIGSGPMKVEKVTKNASGIPSSIGLTSFKKYTLERPKIKSIVFKFFQNETALLKAYKGGEVESLSGMSPIKAKENLATPNMIEGVSLPRVFGVFLNQNVAPVFLNKEIREALDKATPRQKIIDEVLFGFGSPLNGPTPENIETDPEQMLGNILEAQNILEKAGWKTNADGVLEKKTKSGTVLFSFAISTSDAPELKRTAEILKEAWEALGARVDIKIFEAGDLSQNIIKSRKYDALLFGEVVGSESDLFPFWHSSERNDPGLNISLYTNISVDKLLEEIQKETDPSERMSKRNALVAEIKKDTPAIFLFAPDLLYLKAPGVKNVKLRKVSAQSERFISLSGWFIETDKVWKFFTNYE